VAPGGLNIKGNVNITGTATATGEVEGNGIKLSTHEHSGVTAGGGTSGPPVP
jgi:phage baseplate assembly protein gpV